MRFVTDSRVISAAVPAINTSWRRLSTPRRKPLETNLRSLVFGLCCSTTCQITAADGNPGPKTQDQDQSPELKGLFLEVFMTKYVGQRVKRTEDPRLIKGLAHYVDDIRLPDTSHVAF